VWLDRLEAEHDNLRATLAWAIEHDPSTALRLVAALWRFWYMRGHMREGRAWAEAALARSGGSPGERARALHVAGDLAQEQGDYPRASALLSIGREVALAAGDPAVAALCLNGLGFIARNLGAFEEAATHHAEALELQRGLEDRRAIACTLANLGSIAQNRGEVESAETLFAEALATFRTIDDRALAADVSTNLAILANQVGDHERAHSLAADALVTYRALGDRQACATALAAVAKAERGLGAAAQAEERYEEALTLFRSVDHQLGIAVVLDHLAGLRLDEADPEAARPLLTESLHILQATGDRPEIITALETVIRVARALNLWHAVARLSGAIATLRAAVDTGPRAIEIVDQGPILAAADALGELEFSAAEAAGRVLRQEEALAEALRIVELGA
jgi:tetratricopeptide (TPR) repeat protein